MYNILYDECFVQHYYFSFFFFNHRSIGSMNVSVVGCSNLLCIFVYIISHYQYPHNMNK